MADMCGAAYRRDEVIDFGGARLVLCSYVKDHVGSHSWSALKMKDEEDIAAAVKDEDDETPFVIQDILDGLQKGIFDPYIEAILAAGHSRKRALRGVRGFPDLSKPGRTVILEGEN